MSAEWRALLIGYEERQDNEMVVMRVDLTVTHVSADTGRNERIQFTWGTSYRLEKLACNVRFKGEIECFHK